MPRTHIRLAALAVLALLLPACATQQAAEPEPPRMMGYEEFVAYASAPGVLFGGQPSPEALDCFKNTGGSLVVNLRTDKELAFYPYYDMARDAQGFEYAHIQCSGSTMGLAEYRAFKDAYEAASAEGSPQVLLHCASGGRAKTMWAIHEQETLGLSREEILANAAARGQDSERAQAFVASVLDRVALEREAGESS